MHWHLAFSFQVQIKKMGLDKSFALKQMKKHYVKQTRQIEHVKSEKNILKETHCDFIVKYLVFVIIFKSYFQQMT